MQVNVILVDDITYRRPRAYGHCDTPQQSHRDRHQPTPSPLLKRTLGGAIGTVAGRKLATCHGRLPVVRWSYALTILAVTGVVFSPAHSCTRSSH